MNTAFRAWSMVGLLIVVGGCGAADRGGSPLEARVDDLFRRAIPADGPGCAVGVYQNGRTVLTRGYGLANVETGQPITPRTAFNLGSASKPFTALAAVMLEAQGVLSADDDVRRWVPELPDYGKPIRISDLLHHTSGVRDFGALAMLRGRAPKTMREFLDLVAAQKALNFEPGQRHEYSHSDFFLLSLVVERATREPFGPYLERTVLQPLAMSGSFVHDGRPVRDTDRAVGHRLEPDGPRLDSATDDLTGGDNVYASVEDLAGWDRFLAGASVGGEAALARMLSRPRMSNGDVVPYAYGLRMGQYRGLRTISRNGHSAGMNVEWIRFPDRNTGVAVFCNGEQWYARPFAQSVADIALESEMETVAPVPEAPAAVTMFPEALVEYAGTYVVPGQPASLLPIEVRNGALGEVIFDDKDDERFYPMTPAGRDRFFERGATGNIGLYVFQRGADGVVRGLEISWNGEPPERLERVRPEAVWRPSAVDLSAYVGTWFSDELDATWTIESRDARLVLRRDGHRDLTLRAIAPDHLARGFGSAESLLHADLMFERDGGGRASGLVVSTPAGEDSARGVKFSRVAGR